VKPERTYLFPIIDDEVWAAIKKGTVVVINAGPIRDKETTYLALHVGAHV